MQADRKKGKSAFTKFGVKPELVCRKRHYFILTAGHSGYSILIGLTQASCPRCERVIAFFRNLYHSSSDLPLITISNICFLDARYNNTSKNITAKSDWHDVNDSAQYWSVNTLCISSELTEKMIVD